MGLFDLFKRSGEFYTVTYDEEEGETPTHGSWNNWECDDPTCICHGAQETNTPIPMPWEALQEKQDRKRR
jgi:hypothetical protein